MKALRVALPLLALACTKPAPPAGEALEPLTAFAKADELIAAGRNEVASGDPEAPIRLTGAWRWTPSSRTPLVIWSLCQGEQDAQGCVLFVGRVGERVEVLAHAPIGWAPPKLRIAKDGVVIEGEDGRSAFTRRLRFEAGRPAIGEATRPEGF